jgi:predicted dehydrogenase
MIRLGQIGVGYWGKNLLRNFTELHDCEVTWICDIAEDVRDRVRTSHPNTHVTADAADLFADPDLDAVVIATPATTHAAIARDALAAGKHVFVEKPMALTVQDAQSLVDAAEKANRILMVGHLLEYHPAFTCVKDMIDRGDLGDIYYLYSTRVNLGRVREDENAMWSLAPHDISIALMMVPDEPVSVVANGHAYLQPGIEDVAFVSLRFAGGKIAHMHVSWLDPHKVRQITVVGSKKMAVIDDQEPSEKVRIYDKGVNWTGQYRTYGEALTLRTGDIFIPQIEMTEPLRVECQTYLDAIATGKQPRSDGRDGLRVVKVLAAAEESLKNGGTPVAIS